MHAGVFGFVYAILVLLFVPQIVDAVREGGLGITITTTQQRALKPNKEGQKSPAILPASSKSSKKSSKKGSSLKLEAETEHICGSVQCPSGTSCDQADGSCKMDDELVPCIAVIDEDTEFGWWPSQADLWNTFREKYPARPFCLLVPTIRLASEGTVAPPENFLSDAYAIVRFDVARDYGLVENAEDWTSLCGLQDYHSGMSVGFVGLFVDDSSSMYQSHVMASYNQFLAEMKSRNIEVKEVENEWENWIEPFLTTLAPPPGCVASVGNGTVVEGQCIDKIECIAAGKTPIPRVDELDPEPNCFIYPAEVQCCTAQNPP